MKISPTQKLYLYSLVENGVFSRSNMLVTLIYEATKINKISFRNDKYKVEDVKDDEIIEPYLERFLITLKYNMYNELLTFLDELNFKPFAQRNGFITVIKRKGLFAKDKILNNTTLYEEIKDIRGKNNYIRILCNNEDLQSIDKLTGKLITKLSELEK